MIIDSHCHIDFDTFNQDRTEVLAHAASLGIHTLIVPAITSATWQRVKSVCRQHSGLYPCYGLHPYFIDQHTDDDLDKLDAWLANEPAVALGECGLDFYLKELDQTKQHYFFEAQLALASKHQLPVVIHSRKATEQVIQALKKYPELTGMMHSFSGSYEQARQLTDMGFYISFGGPVTYPAARRLRELVSRLPLESLLIETDAPDQPDFEHQGQRNEPGYIRNVISAIAELKNTSKEQVINTTCTNAKKLFSI